LLQDLLYTLILLTVFTVPALLIFFVGRFLKRKIAGLKLSKYISQQLHGIGHPAMQFFREVAKEFEVENDVDKIEQDDPPESTLDIIKVSMLEGIGRLFNLVFGAFLIFFLCVFFNIAKVVKQDDTFYVHIWKKIYTIPNELIFAQDTFERVAIWLAPTIMFSQQSIELQSAA